MKEDSGLDRTQFDNVNFILRTNVYYRMYIPDTLNWGCLKIQKNQTIANRTLNMPISHNFFH